MAESTPVALKDRHEIAAPEHTRGGVHFSPRVDIFEDARELTLWADMPGVRSEDIDLRYERGELVVHGKVNPRPRHGNVLVNEYEEGDFFRVFTIHESIDSNKIEAQCKNGVLTVHLPKVESAQPKQIMVRGG